ncbi:MAG: cysteine desulfurase family protein [Eubacteriales bacterium]|nr:cysteine desulfurase family protein [Eubacteriales bacterium]
MIYLDYAATSPAYPAVLDEMDRISRYFYANPSSLYTIGYTTRKILHNSRAELAGSIGAETDEIVFTSGGTESNNLALYGVLHANHKKKHLIVGNTEHQSILSAARALEREGYLLSILSCDENGRYSPQELQRIIRSDTALVSLQIANHETGVLQPIAEIGAITRASHIPFHCDAVAAYGHIPLDVRVLKIDLLSTAAHKIGGPRGAGFLYVRNEIALVPLFFGGSQERALRPGTENLPAIAGFAKALRLSTLPAPGDVIDRLQTLLRARFPTCRINGGNVPRLPHILNVTFPGVSGEQLMYQLSAAGIFVSMRAACAGGERTPSHVLTAMGLSAAEASATMRFSSGFDSKLSDADETSNAIDFAIQQQIRT